MRLAMQILHDATADRVDIETAIDRTIAVAQL